MNKIYLVTYGDEKFANSKKNLINSASNLGEIDECVSYDKNDLINSDIYEECKHIIDQPRGGGYWLFNPYYILKTLNAINYNDYVIWLDSGTEIINSIKPLIDISEETDSFLIKMPYKQSEWTKMDCFYYMDMVGDEYFNSSHFNASHQIYKKTDFNIKFVTEYLKFSKDYRISTDSPNECGLENKEDFKDHRHPQSILSLLSYKYKLNGYMDPSQYYTPQLLNSSTYTDFEIQKSKMYSQIINHHR